MTIAEIDILRGIQEIFQCAFLDTIMPPLTSLGNKGIIWIVLAVFLLLFRKTRKLGLAVGFALIFDLILCNITLKPLIARIRPFEIVQFELLIASPHDFSFPSGHTAASFSAVFALVFSKSKIYIPSLILAVIIAFSRLYLFVHYPSDILGGIIVGFVCGYLGSFIVKKIFEYFENKKSENISCKFSE